MPWRLLKHTVPEVKPEIHQVRDMVQVMREAELTIIRGKSNKAILILARKGHGVDEDDTAVPFFWSNFKARAAIRHGLTNYEELLSLLVHSRAGDPAYEELRRRIDALVDRAYPRFAEGMPQVLHPQMIG